MLTKKELNAIKGLESYYCSLDFIETDGYGTLDKEAQESSIVEQLIKNGLGKLIKFYEQKKQKVKQK